MKWKYTRKNLIINMIVIHSIDTDKTKPMCIETGLRTLNGWRLMLTKQNQWFSEMVKVWTNWSSESFCYFGLLLIAMSNFMLRKTVVIRFLCIKAHLSLNRKCCNIRFIFTTLLSLFDTYVGSIAMVMKTRAFILPRK